MRVCASGSLERLRMCGSRDQDCGPSSTFSFPLLGYALRRIEKVHVGGCDGEREWVKVKEWGEEMCILCGSPAIEDRGEQAAIVCAEHLRQIQNAQRLNVRGAQRVWRGGECGRQSRREAQGRSVTNSATQQRDDACSNFMIS